jgi:hypothetical protein
VNCPHDIGSQLSVSGRAVFLYSGVEFRPRRTTGKYDRTVQQHREGRVRYLCLVYSEEQKLETMTDDECMAYDAAIRESGQCLASEALQPVRTATTVRVRSGKVSITDGPFAETKEQLAGFYLIDAKDLDGAIQIASKIPPAEVGCIEVRPVRELVSTKGERRSETR